METLLSLITEEVRLPFPPSLRAAIFTVSVQRVTLQTVRRSKMVRVAALWARIHLAPVTLLKRAAPALPETRRARTVLGTGPGVLRQQPQRKALAKLVRLLLNVHPARVAKMPLTFLFVSSIA